MNPIYRTKEEFELAQLTDPSIAGMRWDDYNQQYNQQSFNQPPQSSTPNLFNNNPFSFTDRNVNPQTGEIIGLPQNNNWFGTPNVTPPTNNIAMGQYGSNDIDGNKVPDFLLNPNPQNNKVAMGQYTANDINGDKVPDYILPPNGFEENKTEEDDKTKKPSFLDYLSQMPNLGMGISTDDKFKIAGMSMAYKPDFLNNTDLEKKAKRANRVVGISAGAAGALGAVRNIMQGMGIQKRQNQWNDTYWKDQRDLQKQEYKYYEDGGELPMFRFGGTFLDIPYSKMALDEYISGLPKAMEEMANAEIEDEEWIIDPTNAVKKAIGKTHEKGGIKTVLEPGTKVVSDNLKLGAKLSKEISNEVGVKVTMNHTYADAIDRFNKKIGLEEKNLELEKLYKKLEKNDNITNESTKRLNETFLIKEIEKAEQERQRLLEARAVFANKIYNKQQENKLEKFEDGGMFKGGTFEALCKKFNLTKEQGLQMLKQYEDGGQQLEQPQAPQQMDEETIRQIIEMYSQMVSIPQEELTQQFLGMSEEQLQEELMRMSAELQQNNVMKNGGKIPMYKDGNPPNIQSLIDAYQTKPSYAFNQSSLPQMKIRLKEAATEWGLTEEDINKIESAKTVSDLDKIAGQMQSKVLEKNPEIAQDFGLKIAPTKAGLKYLSGLTDKELKDKEFTDAEIKAIKNAKSGSFKGIPESMVENITSKASQKFANDENYAKTNFKDDEWFFRYPSVKETEFKTQKEYDDYLSAERVAGRTLKTNGEELVISPKTGLYIRPKAPQNITTTPTTTTTPETPKTEKEVLEQEYKQKFEDLKSLLRTKSRPDNGMLFVPDTPNLPPDGIFPHVKREFRTELIDPMAISPESVLRENYRTQETSNMNLDNLPIGMRGAANANLTAITQENNAKAILEAERFNAQNKQSVEQANVQLNNQDEMMRYNEIPRYEALQLTAMEKTKNDLYNYFNAGIENQMNKYNYKNSYNITKSMFPEITTDMFGVPMVKQDTRTYFDTNYSKKEETKKKGK